MSQVDDALSAYEQRILERRRRWGAARTLTCSWCGAQVYAPERADAIREGWEFRPHTTTVQCDCHKAVQKFTFDVAVCGECAGRPNEQHPPSCAGGAVEPGRIRASGAG